MCGGSGDIFNKRFRANKIRCSMLHNNNDKRQQLQPSNQPANQPTTKINHSTSTKILINTNLSASPNFSQTLNSTHKVYIFTTGVDANL